MNEAGMLTSRGLKGYL